MYIDTMYLLATCHSHVEYSGAALLHCVLVFFTLEQPCCVVCLVFLTQRGVSTLPVGISLSASGLNLALRLFSPSTVFFFHTVPGFHSLLRLF